MSEVVPVHSIYVESDPEDDRTQLAFEMVVTKLADYAMQYVEDPAEADAMIVVGGDGSFLHAVKKHNFTVPHIAGVSTGTLGYFMGTEPNEKSIDYLVRNLKEGDYCLSNLPVLELKDTKGQVRAEALGDIIVRAAKFQAFKAELLVGDSRFEHFVGNGLLFATPQGSSAEAIGEGGSYIQEGAHLYEMVPQSPHMSGLYYAPIAPMILMADTRVKVLVKEADKRSFEVGADGAEVEWPKGETELELGLSPVKSIPRIRFRDHSYLQDISRIFRGQSTTGWRTSD